MLSSRRLSAVAVTVAALAAAPVAADARTHTITPGAYVVKRVGSFKTKSTRDYRPTIRHASRRSGSLKPVREVGRLRREVEEARAAHRVLQLRWSP